MNACEVVVADFAWWSQACGKPGVRVIQDEEGEDRSLCAEHAAQWSAR